MALLHQSAAFLVTASSCRRRRTLRGAIAFPTVILALLFTAPPRLQARSRRHPHPTPPSPSHRADERTLLLLNPTGHNVFDWPVRVPGDVLERLFHTTASRVIPVSVVLRERLPYQVAGGDLWFLVDVPAWGGARVRLDPASGPGSPPASDRAVKPPLTKETLPGGGTRFASKALICDLDPGGEVTVTVGDSHFQRVAEQEGVPPQQGPAPGAPVISSGPIRAVARWRTTLPDGANWYRTAEISPRYILFRDEVDVPPAARSRAQTSPPEEVIQGVHWSGSRVPFLTAEGYGSVTLPSGAPSPLSRQPAPLPDRVYSLDVSVRGGGYALVLLAGDRRPQPLSILPEDAGGATVTEHLTPVAEGPSGDRYTGTLLLEAHGLPRFPDLDRQAREELVIDWGHGALPGDLLTTLQRATLLARVAGERQDRSLRGVCLDVAAQLRGSRRQFEQGRREFGAFALLDALREWRSLDLPAHLETWAGQANQRLQAASMRDERADANRLRQAIVLLHDARTDLYLQRQDQALTELTHASSLLRQARGSTPGRRSRR